jgi:hypothetical protein
MLKSGDGWLAGLLPRNREKAKKVAFWILALLNQENPSFEIKTVA